MGRREDVCKEGRVRWREGGWKGMKKRGRKGENHNERVKNVAGVRVDKRVDNYAGVVYIWQTRT